MRRVLVAAVLVAAALSIGGARAYFTAQAEVKDNVITAGTVALSVEPTAAALSIDPLAPGETVVREMVVRNTGVLPLDAVTTAVKKAGYTDLWNALTCVASVDGTVVYEGPLASMATRPVRIAAGKAATIRYTVGIPASAGNDLQGDYVRASLYVDAQQAH